METGAGTVQDTAVVDMPPVPVLYGLWDSGSYHVIGEEHVDVVIVVCLHDHGNEVLHVGHDETVVAFQQLEEVQLLDGKERQVVHKIIEKAAVLT